ncbi:MAG: hypothetical protein RLZZ34_857, partial [Verrucomicrobiota bacterium]
MARLRNRSGAGSGSEIQPVHPHVQGLSGGPATADRPSVEDTPYFFLPNFLAAGAFR